MQYHVTINAFTMLGGVHLAARVRTDNLEGAIVPVLDLAIDVPDDGEPDPHEFLANVCSWLLEDLSNRARHAL